MGAGCTNFCPVVYIAAVGAYILGWVDDLEAEGSHPVIYVYASHGIYQLLAKAGAEYMAAKCQPNEVRRAFQLSRFTLSTVNSPLICSATFVISVNGCMSFLRFTATGVTLTD